MASDPRPIGERLAQSAQAGVARLAASWPAILQSAVAAGIAWFLAGLIVGRPQPFFAPAAAVISLGLSRGQPRRRAVELSLGVAAGIGAADLLTRLIGVGAVQVAAVVALAMAMALLLGGGMLLVNQAAISAILVMTLPGQGAAFERFLDALIGGAVAVAMAQVLLFRDPVGEVEEARSAAFVRLAEVLEQLAGVLDARELGAAEAALASSRALDVHAAGLYEAIEEAAESLVLSPRRRELQEQLDPLAAAAPHVDYAVRNTRVLARAATTAVRRGIPIDPSLPAALAILAEAARALARQSEAAREVALRAVNEASSVAQEELWATMVVGQVRALAFDFLQALGVEPEAARRAIDAASAAAGSGEGDGESG